MIFLPPNLEFSRTKRIFWKSKSLLQHAIIVLITPQGQSLQFHAMEVVKTLSFKRGKIKQLQTICLYKKQQHPNASIVQISSFADDTSFQMTKHRKSSNGIYLSYNKFPENP